MSKGRPKAKVSRRKSQNQEISLRTKPPQLSDQIAKANILIDEIGKGISDVARQYLKKIHTPKTKNHENKSASL